MLLYYTVFLISLTRSSNCVQCSPYNVCAVLNKSDYGFVDFYVEKFLKSHKDTGDLLRHRITLTINVGEI